MLLLEIGMDSNQYWLTVNLTVFALNVIRVEPIFLYGSIVILILILFRLAKNLFQ